MLEDIAAVGITGILFLVMLVFLFLPATMATRRGRSGLLWFLIGLMFSPLAAIILLLILGDAAYQGGKR